MAFRAQNPENGTACEYSATVSRRRANLKLRTSSRKAKGLGSLTANVAEAGGADQQAVQAMPGLLESRAGQDVFVVRVDRLDLPHRVAIPALVRR